MTVNAVPAAVARHVDALAPDAQLYVAFSGGLDSTVLLHVCAALYPARVRALHANHALQADADRWDTHCHDLCARWGIVLQSHGLTVTTGGDGPESAARSARYRWFESVLDTRDVLLMAHHQDDQAETLMLRLLRGAGPDGLAGMPAQRTLGRGLLLRPLLALPRSALETYASDHSLSWIEDPSNSDLSFDRNYLRREVMPRLERRWPGYRKTLTRAAGQLREWTEQRPGPELAVHHNTFGDPGFNVSDLPADVASAALAVRHWLRQQSLLAPPAVRLQEFLRQLCEGQGASMRGDGWELERYRDGVYRKPPHEDQLHGRRSVDAGETLLWSGLGPITVTAAREEPVAGLYLCARSGGERLATAAGQHQDLKTLFQSLGVPPWWRDRLPLLWRRASAGDELLAVAHLARSPEAASLGLAIVCKSDDGTQK